MIALPAAVVIGLALLLAAGAVKGMGREATNLAHVSDDDYERQGPSWGVLALLVILGLALLGITGAGPLVGVLVLAQ